MTSFADVATREWDCVVVGTGVGGATLGYALARGGKRVLVLEKGMSPRSAPMIKGQTPEDAMPRLKPLTEGDRDLLRRGGRYFQPYSDRTKGSGTPFFPLLGCGVGGSSALYGAILERLHPVDFTPSQGHPNAADSTIPKEWPVSYDELVPYYERAEAVYSVKASPFSRASEALSQRLSAQGLHPYHLPTATKFLDGCRNCQGMICGRDCKIDSYQACLAPALDRHGAVLLEDCEVVNVVNEAHRVTGLTCRVDGREQQIAARMVALGAGALETPRLLLNSTSARWPNGLANGSGMVGRNLMRHLIDLYVMNLSLTPKSWGKEIGIQDFYATSGGKYGAVHGMGPMPVNSSLAELIRNPFMRLATPILRGVLRKFEGRFMFASFLEDLPFADNRVFGGPTTTFQYRVHPYDERRLKEFRSLLRPYLKPSTKLAQTHINERVFHACGTCRFGNDPGSSVVDRNNRAHDLENLYVVDASFMPTSGGTAPSLTIAANALRVADHLLGTTAA